MVTAHAIQFLVTTLVPLPFSLLQRRRIEAALAGNLIDLSKVEDENKVGQDLAVCWGIRTLWWEGK
jgi:hypothetical protein